LIIRPQRHTTIDELSARKKGKRDFKKMLSHSIGNSGSNGSISNTEEDDLKGRNVLDGVGEEGHPTEHIIYSGVVK
jgi:hypothetical protein